MTGLTTSVVLPVYNGASVIRETVESILVQTDRDFELVIVDDGSTDSTAEILGSYARRDERVRLITQTNAGITHALMAGCAAAQGKYIARHDVGDVSRSDRIQKQRAVLDEEPTVVLVSCWTAVVGPELEPLFVARGAGKASKPTDVRDLSNPYCAIDGPTHHGSVMFRRDAYERAGGYRRPFYYGQDWDLWYRLFDLGKFQMVEEVLYTARITATSISTSAKIAQEEIASYIHESVRARARGEPDAHFVELAARIRPKKPSRRATALGFYFIGEALRRNRDARARAYFVRAIFRWPLLLRASMRLLQTVVRK